MTAAPDRSIHLPALAKNIVIVTLDTTRADRLSPYGFMDASMPALDRLAREGVIFDQASSVAPLTLPAHTSLFTGLLPPTHEVRDNADRPLEARFATLAEVLHAFGFRTGAFVGSVVLGSERGLSRGFEHYGNVGDVDGLPRQRRADTVITDAIAWLTGIKDERFLLWTHLYDAHRPYDAPAPYRSRISNPYVAEIAFADSQVGRLLDALDARHLTDRTTLIVAGDHGESLGDHGESDHGVFVYESVLRIPLIIRTPGITPKRVGSVVRLTDVMPTALDLLGIPGPAVDGASLIDLLTGSRRDLDLEAYSESEYPRRRGWSPLHALRDRRFKLIDAPRPELYDLERDPFEERNVYDQRRTMAAAMTRRLQTLTRRSTPRSGESFAGGFSVPAGLDEQLAALGYTGRTLPPAQGAQHLPDPKDCLSLDTPLPRSDEFFARSASSRCQ